MEQPWTATTFQQNQNPNLVGREDLRTFDYSESQSGNNPLLNLSYNSSNNYEQNSDFSDKNENNSSRTSTKTQNVNETLNEESIFLKPNFVHREQESQNDTKNTSHSNNNENEDRVYFNLNSIDYEHINSGQLSENSNNQFTDSGQLQTYNSNDTNITQCDSNFDSGLHNVNTHFHDEFNSNSINSAINDFGANKYHRTSVNNNHIDKNYKFTNAEELNSYNSVSDVTSSSEAQGSYTNSNNRQTFDTENNYNFSQEDNNDFAINSTSYFDTQCKYNNNSETVNLVGSSDIKVINKENTHGREVEKSSRNSDCVDNYANANFTTTFCNKTYETSRTAHEILIKNHNLTTANATSHDITSNNDKLHGGDINLVSEHHRQLQDNNKFYASSSSMFYSNGTYQYEGINNSNSFSSATPSQFNADINETPSNIKQNGVYESNILYNFIGDRQILPSNFNNTCKGNEINDGAASSYGNFYSDFTENNRSQAISNKSGKDGFEIEKEQNNGANLNKLNENTEVKGNELPQSYNHMQNDCNMNFSAHNPASKVELTRKFSNSHNVKSIGNPNSRESNGQGNLQNSGFSNQFLPSLTAKKRGHTRGSYPSSIYNAPARYQHHFTPRFPHQLYHSYPDHQYQVRRFQFDNRVYPITQFSVQ